MYGKPHLDSNAHTYACARAINDMQQIADDQTLTPTQRLLARQCRDLAAALHTSLTESNNGQSI
jgi:hypothetical protein